MITKKSALYSLKTHGTSFQGTSGWGLFIQLSEQLLSLTLVLLQVSAGLKEDTFLLGILHENNTA